MHRCIATWLATCLLTLAAPAVTAQEILPGGQTQAPPDELIAPQPAAAPIDGPAGAQLDILIRDVRGLVQMRQAEDRPWQAAVVGQQLTEGAEFRTGPRSAVLIGIGETQTLTLDRLGTIKILEAIERARDGKIKTEVGMKYGRSNYKIEAAGKEHESNFVTPGATLAIRGSQVESFRDAFDGYASGKGQLMFFNHVRRVRTSFGRQTRAKIDLKSSNQVQLSRSENTVRRLGQFAGQTATEIYQTEQEPGTGGNDLSLARGIRQPRRVRAVIGVPDLPGPFSFTLSWFSTAFPAPSNLDLVIRDPLGNRLAGNPALGSDMVFTFPPAGANDPARGEFLTGDEMGTAGFGLEQGQWPRFFPNGTYNVAVRNQGGAPSTFFLNAARGMVMNPVDINFPPDTVFEMDGSILLHPGEVIVGRVVVPRGTGISRAPPVFAP